MSFFPDPRYLRYGITEILSTQIYLRVFDGRDMVQRVNVRGAATSILDN